MTDRSIAIIGAGIIGVAAAFRFAGLGYAVTLYDRLPPGRGGPSFGNAGHIAGSDIFPLSAPGIGLNGLRMLVNPDAPLKIAPDYALRLAPWLWQFRKAGLGRAHADATAAISHLCDGAVAATEALFAEAGISHLFQRMPTLYVYDTAQSLAASLLDWEKKRDAGHGATFIERDEVARLEPALSAFAGGVLSHDWGVVSDPFKVLQGLFAAAAERGVVFRQTAVSEIVPDGAGVGITSGDGRHSYAQVIIAAGVHSRAIAASLGENLPVEAEGGYNITYPSPGVAVKHPVVFADKGLVSTTLDHGLRIGGWAEFSGINGPAKPQYFDRIERINQSVLPGLNPQGGQRWMGKRPSMPDSVPVLSRSTRSPHVIYATGHGHYGLSWAARSVQILTDILSGKEGANPYSIARFNRGSEPHFRASSHTLRLQ